MTELSLARGLLASSLALATSLAWVAAQEPDPPPTATPPTGTPTGGEPIVGATTGELTGDDTFFIEKVRPILEANCFKCHGGRRRIRGGLNLTTRAGLVEGGELGPGIDLEQPAESRLLAMISYKDIDHEMPPDGKLDDADIGVLTRWVTMGAPYAADADAAATDPEDEDGGDGEAREPAKLGRDDGLAGWSYRPLARPPLPEVDNRPWVTNPIDAFVLARLEAAGLAPAPPAGKVALLRRAFYDLIGLPPTPADVEAFLADSSPDAFARVVEDLLARPQYGEKWGRHWLDVVRYAETNGYERDSDKPFIWRYRDWVIDSFNADKPYDRFVLEQLAGDELDDATPESIVATGYTRLMQWDDEPGQGVLQARYDTLDDLVSTTAQGFLGMTIGCARCHDHKGDPIPQTDYYSFVAFFHGLTDVRRDGNFTEIFTPAERAERDRIAAQKEADIERLTRERRGIEERLLARRAELGAGSGAADGAAFLGLEELSYRFYRDTWSALPDFDALKPEDEGRLAHGLLDLSPATREESFGFVFEGLLVVPREGTYRFRLASDDGARLSVDGMTVIDHDGIHGLGEAREGALALPAGRVPLRLDYFQGGGGQGLRVWWGPDTDREWAYTFEQPEAGWHEEDFDDSAWLRGPGGFGRPGTPGSVIGTQWTSADVWLRRNFEWEADGRELVFALHQDDDVEVYVNGVLAAKRASYLTDYVVEEPSTPARNALRRGTNLLAVHCAQDFGGQYVDVAPIERGRLGSATLTDLAFGRWPLSLGAAGDALDVPREMESRGATLVGEEAVERWRALGKELDAARKREVPRAVAFAAQEREHIPDMHVHVRGNASAPGEKVEPAFPRCLNPPPAMIPPRAGGATSSGRRRTLAEWIVSPDNPITARVIANRVWQHHFGRGIVRTPNDFGEFGERPTHPLLLDWLACETIARGWSLKDVHRLIMASSAYRMSSRPSTDALMRDPANDLFSRFDMRRLTAEEMRDTILWIAGVLNLERGGASFYSRMPVEALQTSSRPNEVWGRSSEEQQNRRSVYIKVKRSLVTPLLAVFDFADTDSSCPARFVTTQPGQALTLMNSAFLQEQASLFAERLTVEAGEEREAQVRLALRLATASEPSAAAVADDVRLIAELERDFELDPRAALEKYCLLTLNLNEFCYLD